MLLQADYSSSIRMDAVHRGRQINESVMDDVAASMLGACRGLMTHMPVQHLFVQPSKCEVGSLNGMGESMPRNVNSSHMKQAFVTRQKTSQKRARLRRMKELYASHLGSSAGGMAQGGIDSDGNKSASEDELLQVRPLNPARGAKLMPYFATFCAVLKFHALGELISVQWSATLSFEAYHNSWEAVASTASDTLQNVYASSTNAVTTTPLPLSHHGV